jgi:CHASE3 domain sensor protein
MNELIMIGILLFVTIVGVYYFILCSISNTRKQIIAKQDAIMAKLIEIKHR